MIWVKCGFGDFGGKYITRRSILPPPSHLPPIHTFPHTCLYSLPLSWSRDSSTSLQHCRGPPEEEHGTHDDDEEGRPPAAAAVLGLPPPPVPALAVAVPGRLCPCCCRWSLSAPSSSTSSRSRPSLIAPLSCREEQRGEGQGRG